jgi:hypothetical protein
MVDRCGALVKDVGRIMLRNRFRTMVRSGIVN